MFMQDLENIAMNGRQNGKLKSCFLRLQLTVVQIQCVFSWVFSLLLFEFCQERC